MDEPDVYEDDDAQDQANIIVVNNPNPQQHHFHDAEDCVKFYGVADETYEI